MPLTAAEQTRASMKSYGRDGAQPQPHFLKIILTTVSRAVAWRRRGGDEHDAFNREKHQLRAGFFPLRLERGEGQGDVSKLIQPRMDTNEIGFGLSPNACSQNRIVTKVSAGRGAFGLRRLQRHCWNARKPSVLPGFVRTKAPRISECDFNLKTRLRVCPPAVPPENPRRRRGPSIARPR